MNRLIKQLSLPWIFLSILAISAMAADTPSLGIFENHTDIGESQHSGSVDYNAVKEEYRITGGGANMWFENDAFHFIWKRVSGDFFLQADIDWIGDGGDPHRKACLMIRQSLSPSSKYADAALHGDGLTSLQYREADGTLTREVQANVRAPQHLRITREGGTVFISYADEDEGFTSAGGSFQIHFSDPVYVGLGVCAHDDNRTETAVFSRVALTPLEEKPDNELRLESTLETVAIASKDRRAIYRAWDHFEAPNWSPDGQTLLFNSRGRLYTIPVAGGKPVMLNTGFANRCNNDHGYSSDGSLLAISDQSDQSVNGRSLIYVLPSSGGEPRRVTELGPSYWHGWSPNGKTLAYCAERDGEYDIYTIPVEGGQETRLTTAAGLDDGPDYSPDGEYIYFNSDRTGTMQIWRMRTDGSNQEQITHDEYNDCFPHPSPDGRWIVFLSYDKDVEGHPADKNVMLRLMQVDGGEMQILAKLFGGQGTINVPSWSPDSRNVAFVSYRYTKEYAQNREGEIKWNEGLRQPREWYSSLDALRIAENVMLYQREIGGWTKNIDMALPLSATERRELQRVKNEKEDATIDNGATTTQLAYLAWVYNQTHDSRIRDSFLRGLDFLLNIQYDNGGWPQFPFKRGYYQRITFNDDAMIRVMNLLREIEKRDPPYGFIDEERREKARQAMNRGIHCILNTQIVVDGKLTAWCAQHNEKTLQPAPARTYEKVSLSGSEGVGIVRFLMSIENPSPEIVKAVDSAVQWFQEAKLTGINEIREKDPSTPRGYDKVIVEDASAPPLWARFYEIGTNRPIFSGRDGIVKYNLSEIEYERRTGYSWYTNRPSTMFKEYEEWKRKNE